MATTGYELRSILVYIAIVKALVMGKLGNNFRR